MFTGPFQLVVRSHSTFLPCRRVLSANATTIHVTSSDGAQYTQNAGVSRMQDDEADRQSCALHAMTPSSDTAAATKNDFVPRDSGFRSKAINSLAMLIQ